MILIVDNYDSFTWNVYQAMAMVASGERIQVVRNDAMSVGELRRCGARCVVLSPGPGAPEGSRLSLEVSGALPDTPVLGVCLGHQALAVAAGARVSRSPRPTHGRDVLIEHDQRAPFDRLPSPTRVALYHSLVVQEEVWPDELCVAARTLDGDVMAIRHRSRPHVGVQFHPESFMTTGGLEILRSFVQRR